MPRSLRAIDADWLTDALREAGHDAPAVDAVSFEAMSGVIGGIARVRVASNGIGTPLSVNETGHLRVLTAGSQS